MLLSWLGKAELLPREQLLQRCVEQLHLPSYGQYYNGTTSVHLRLCGSVQLLGVHGGDCRQRPGDPGRSEAEGDADPDELLPDESERGRPLGPDRLPALGHDGVLRQGSLAHRGGYV